MPSLDLGRVKGDPLTWEDLTEEQRLSLKGEKGDTPKVKAGTTTIVKYNEGAAVTSETNGDVTSFNFQIPVGQKPPFYGAYENFPEVGEVERTYIDDTVDPRLMYTWDDIDQKYVLTGGAGGADGSSMDIQVTLPAAGWTGSVAPYQQTVTIPQMREDMTPFHFFAGDGDTERYAYSLIMDYQAGYAQMTFYAADLPEVDIHLTLKGVPAQKLGVVDNTVVFLVEPSAFALNEDVDRYEATIAVEGMTAGYGGQWDIVRSGPVLSLEESKIAASITDVIRSDGAVKIVCLEPPAQRYMMSIAGAYPDAEPGTVILSGMQQWFERVEELERNTYQLSGGIEIPENADLNDYIEPGNYYCTTNDIAETISNYPLGFAFTLKVEKGTGIGYPCQTIRELNTGKILLRYKIDGLWRGWIDQGDGKLNVTTRTLTELPGVEENKSFLFTIPSQGNNTGLPAYTRGIYITSGSSDASIMAIDSNTKFHIVYRANGTWKTAREL